MKLVKAIACGAAIAVTITAAGCETRVPRHGSLSARTSGTAVPVPVSPGQAARLPLATTFATLRGAPPDPDPFGTASGLVTHPAAAEVIYARPGGPPIAMLPVTALSSPTWVPVVQARPGWDRVLLPSRPNRSTGWVYAAGGGLRSAYSPYQVRIELAVRLLTVLEYGHRLGSWTVAVGAASTPTPTGRTFLLASLAPVQPSYTPLLLPLGTHSATIDAFGGGPGTVALHGWPDSSVFGEGISHGCVRVPAAALSVLSRIPLGTSIMIVKLGAPSFGAC